MLTSRADLRAIAHRILEISLGLKQGEKCLFFTDSNSRREEQHSPTLVESRRFLHEFYEAFLAESSGSSYFVYDKYESTGSDGAEPAENIWKLAFGDRVYRELVDTDVFWRIKVKSKLSDDELQALETLVRSGSSDVVRGVVAFPWFSTTHTRFRRLLTEAAGCRYISMPQLTEQIAFGALGADWSTVAETTARVAETLLRTRSIHVTCPLGTDLRLLRDPEQKVHTDTGIFHSPGAVGNLPAGEAYFVPMLHSVEGRLILKSCPGRASISPVLLKIDAGSVEHHEGKDPYYHILRRLFTKDILMRHVAEFGVGTNPLARDPGSEIEGEKILGSIHIALGNDSTIGGTVEASEHLDYIVQNPTVSLEFSDGGNGLLIRAGDLLVRSDCRWESATTGGRVRLISTYLEPSGGGSRFRSETDLRL